MFDKDFAACFMRKHFVFVVTIYRYNNKTYRVDDINWEMNPKSKFKGRDGSEQSFVEYYAKVYDKKITDMDQPLLVSRPKKSQVRYSICPLCWNKL